ncbi:HEAT repeat domain-containing protein [Myxococcota bacterium]|nr:HEAT repeat domain-containing protein [Myxococcota bacterium]MBU1899106.1 HEAT repeat domain-containing protein [Myxococcota bacterium]
MAGPSGDERSVGRLMREALRKVRDTAPLYEQNDERALSESIEEISKDLIGLTAEFGELELNITINTITLGEEAAYHSEARQNNVAFDFFRQGLRRLQFQPGLTHREVDIFVRRFAECRSVDLIDEDFISTLWREPLDHISYLAIDAFTEKIFMAEEIFIGRFQGAIRDVMPGLLSMPEADTHDPQPRARKSGFSPVVFKRALRVDEAHPLRAAVEESLRLVEQGLEPKASFDLLAQHLARFALKDPSPLSDEALGEALIRLLEGYLKLTLWQGFADTLHSLWTLLNDQALAAAHHDRFSALRRAVAGAAMAAKIAQLLDPKERNFTRWVRFFLVRAEALTAPELLEAINLCENQAGVALLQDILRHQKSQSLEAWAERLKDPNPTVALEVLEVILSSDLQLQARSLLLEVLAHPGAEVRARALEGLGEGYDRDVREALLPLIRDPAPEVRRVVLQRLVQAKDRSVSPYLASTIRSADFSLFDEEEQRSYCAALGELGGDKFLPLYQELLRMEEGHTLVRKLMQRGSGRLENDPLRRAAVDGLAVVGSKEALGLIREVRRRGTLELGTHCDIALRLAERGEARFEGRGASTTKKRRRRARQCSEEDILLGEQALKVHLLFDLDPLREGKQPPRPPATRQRRARPNKKRSKRQEAIKFGQAREGARAPILSEGEPPPEAEISLILDPSMTGDGTFRLTSPRLSLKAAPRLAASPSAVAEAAPVEAVVDEVAPEASIEAPPQAAEATPLEPPRPQQAPIEAAATPMALPSDVTALLQGFLETPLEPVKPKPPPKKPAPPPHKPASRAEIVEDANSVEGLLKAFLEDRGTPSPRRPPRVAPQHARSEVVRRGRVITPAAEEDKKAHEEMDVDDLLKDFLSQDLGDD